MIRTISDLRNNIFSNYYDIQGMPKNPGVGDVYYDNKKKKIYQYLNDTWKELTVYNKDINLNRVRKRKINKIFNEL